MARKCRSFGVSVGLHAEQLTLVMHVAVFKYKWCAVHT